jgi:hypothetical protein
MITSSKSSCETALIVKASNTNQLVRLAGRFIIRCHSNIQTPTAKLNMTRPVTAFLMR